jgi:hypothetical protein
MEQSRPHAKRLAREEIRRQFRDERRRRVAGQIRRNIVDPSEVSLAEAIAEANTKDLADRLAAPERGGLTP